MIWIIDSFIFAIFLGIVTVMFKLVGQNFHFLDMGILMSLITLIFLFILAIPNLKSIRFLNFYTPIIGVIFGLFNYFFIKAILAYHNPGVISAIVRTQIFLTFIFGTLFLNSLFSWKKLIVIICLIFGAIVTVCDFRVIYNKFIHSKQIRKLKKETTDIKINKHENQKIIEDNFEEININKYSNLKYIIKLHSSKNNQLDFKKYNWIIYLIIAILLYSSYDILSQFKSPKLHISTHSLIIMIFYFLVFLFIYLGNYLYFFLKKKNNTREPVNVKQKYKDISKLRKYGQLLLLGLFNAGLVTFLNKSISIAPSPSSAKGIGASAVLISLILSYFLFEEIPNIDQVIGCIIILICSITLGFI